MRAPTAAPRRELERAVGELDRRGFLRLCTAAAAAGLLPSACGRPDHAPPPGLILRALTPRTYGVFNAATRRIVGSRGADLIARGVVDPARTADAWLAEVPSVAGPFRSALLVLEFAVVPLVGKLRPFTALDPEDQDRVLGELLTSRFAAKRALFNAVKTFGCLSFYAAPESHALIGYPGPLGSSEVPIAAAMAYPLED